MTLICLLLLTTATLNEPVVGVRFVNPGPEFGATPAPQFPDQRISFQVTVTAADDEPLEEPEIAAENQHTDYFKDRVGPNLFVKVARIEADGSRVPVKSRIISSGGGQSLREYSKSVAFDILGDLAARRARIEALFAPARKTMGAAANTPAAMEAQFQAMNAMYISNPPGKYEVTIEYRPLNGRYKGRAFRKVFELVVQNGPDVLDKIERGEPLAPSLQ